MLKLLVGAALVAILVWKAELGSLAGSLRSLTHDTIALAALLYLVACVVAAYRWHVLVAQSRFVQILELWFAGQFYSLVLPGQIAGEIVKAYRLGRGRDDAERLALSVVLDKLTGLVGLLAVAIAGVQFSRTPIPAEITIALALFTFAILACLVSARLPVIRRIVVTLATSAIKRWPGVNKGATRLIKLADAWSNYGADPLRLTHALILGAAFQMICVSMTRLVAAGLGIDLSFADWCWIFGLVSIAVLLPVSIGGIGVREGAFAGTLSLFGIPIAQSVALSLTLFAVGLIGAVIGGIVELRRSLVD